MTKRFLITAVVLALVLAACGKNNDKPAAAKSGPSNIAAKPAVQVGDNATFGRILTDGDGHTLYIFDKDSTSKPNSSCTGGCATNWPALTTDDGAGVGDGLDASLLSHNAAKQFTYNGWPLYRFSGDTAAGDTNGQGVGGIWHVAGIDGKPVLGAAAVTTTTAAPTATTAAHTAATSPPATNPPATQPPATQPPATSPPTTTYQYPY